MQILSGKFILFFRSEKGQYSLALFVLLLFFIFSALSVYGRDRTFDEHSHYKYGRNILNGNSTRVSDSKMPVSAWNVLPAKIAESLPEGFLKIYLSKHITARLMTTVFSALAGFAVFIWARKLYGFIPGLFSLGLYILDPNIIAHSQLITTDVYVMGMILISSYWLWRFARSRKWQHGLVFSITLGLAQLMKYTAIALYPLFAAALLMHDWHFLKDTLQSSGWRGLFREGAWYLKYALLALLVSVLIINIGFLFNGACTPFSEYQFRSEKFQALQQNISFIVPTPYPYLDGLDWVTYRESTGVGYGLIYLFGRLQDEGFPGYFFMASLFKEPIATQLFILAAFVFYFRDRQKRQAFWRNEIFLLLPVLFFAAYFNFFYNAQIGIRHYLVIFPLLFVFAGGLVAGWDGFSLRQKLPVIALAAYLLISVFSYYPYYIPYFNELVWDKTQTYKILADSNLDWGQSRADLNKYLASHPDAKYPTSTPESGHLIISVNHLVGIISDPDRFAWLRQNFEPVDTVAYSYLVYDISQDEISHLCETTDDCK